MYNFAIEKKKGYLSSLGGFQVVFFQFVEGWADKMKFILM